MKDLYPLIIGSKMQKSELIGDVINPYNNQPITKICRASSEHADMAIEAADSARHKTASMPSYKKAEILQKTSDNILAKGEDLAKTITLESGKPINESKAEVKRAALTFRIASEEAVRINGEFLSLDRNELSEKRWGITRRFPCGAVFGITPFNFPLNLVAHKIAPAIAAGNPIVLKPASKTPVTALLLGEILIESGVPENCLSVIPCDSSMAEALVTDRRVRVLSFTGSAAVGWHLKKLAYDKRTLLELGGNAGVIIDRDCDLGYAVDRCVTGAFSYSGQICISVQRIYVHKDLHQTFTEMFIAKTASLRLGDPMDASTQVGPMIDADNLRRIELWVDEARTGGAAIACGGRRDGNFYEPTVILNASPQMKVNCMEIFGPVATISKIGSFTDGLEAVNDSAYGLQAGVFTNNLKNAFSAFETLEVGGVVINDVPNYRADHMPYGGVKMSGSGREGVRYAIEEMTELRLMAMNLK